EFSSIVQSNPINRAILELLPDTGLNDVWLVSGCLFQTVWNDKTGRAPGYGIKDYDLFYYDDSDLSWDAEDTAIRQAMQALAGIDANIVTLPPELRPLEC
ncbi:MAG: nucleotidyltransferase family protein, partial [Pseudomonadota bacterium]